MRGRFFFTSAMCLTGSYFGAGRENGLLTGAGFSSAIRTSSNGETKKYLTGYIIDNFIK